MYFFDTLVRIHFIHYVERIYDATKKPAQGHFPESEGSEVHK